MVSKRATLACAPEHSSSPGTLSLDGTQVGNFSRGPLSGVFVSNPAGLPQTGLHPPASLPDLSVSWAVHEGEVLAIVQANPLRAVHYSSGHARRR